MLNKLPLAIAMATTLSSCAVARTTDKFIDATSGKVIRETTGYICEFGRSEAMSDFADVSSTNGRSITIGSTKGDVNVQAITASSEGLGKIIGTAVRAASGIPAP